MNNIRTQGNAFSGPRKQSNFRGRPGHSTFRPSNNNSNRGRRGGAPVDIHNFIQKSTQVTRGPIVEVAVRNRFSDFKLSPEIQRNLDHKGYKIPTPIQDQAISLILDGRDIIGMANTGTGKTAAFLLPMIEKVYKNRNERVLIITPTRELAQQIEAELHQFSYGMKIFYATCVGGMPIHKQIRDLTTKRPNFVIGTPGRLKDLSNRGYIRFGNFNNVILDEVDRMCDMGFINEIKLFLSQLPQQRQSLFFSATMPANIRELVLAFAKNPTTIQVKSQEAAANVEQSVVRTTRETKFSKLKEILSEPGADRVLIFSETKRGVEKLSTELVSHGFKADSIHGDKRQSQRQRSLANFKQNHIAILVATDVAARGLDIKDVTHVINYTTPQTYEDYVHRIGRTGRADATGKAMTFVE
jgi:superfamily II DNA/RNA helicase